MGQKLTPAGWRGRGKERKRVPVWHYGDSNKCICSPNIHTEYITENVKYVTCPRCREKMKEKE